MPTRIILILSLATLGSLCSLTVDPLTTFLTDQYGRSIFYHGVNVIYKQSPFYPTTQGFDPMTSLSKQDFKNLSSWGIRAIRLFIAWEGFEPKEGEYNYSYLSKVRQIVREAKQYDISVLLDAHQDLYSRKFCGEGFPDWIVQKVSFPAPLKIDLRYENGIPLKQDCMKIKFVNYYKTDDVIRFSKDFFSNKNNMADKFIKMWLNVVSYFKTEDNILGYDIINEPSGADMHKNLYDLLGPGVNNNKYLLPFYKKIAKAIRLVDQDSLLFFQPSVADYFGGFYENPSGPEFSKKDVLSYHTYCPFQDSHNQPSNIQRCKLVDYMYMEQRMKNAKKLKCGIVLTQFGSMPDTQIARDQIKRVLIEADKYWQSWFWWQYKYYADSTSTTNPPWQQSFYYPNGTVQYNKVFVLSYSYAYALCGTPIRQQSSLNSYYLSLVPKKCGDYYTEIYLNQKMYFPKGFTISFAPKCPNCILQSNRNGYYKLIVPENFLFKRLDLKIGGYI